MYAMLRPALDESRMPVPKLVHLLLFSGFYVLAAAVGQWLILVPGHSATLWPPSGLFLGVLLVCSRRSWPTLVVVGWFTDLFAGYGIYSFPLPVAASVALGNTAEAVCGAYLVRSCCGTPFRFSGVSDVLGLALLAAAGSPMISATVGAATMAWTHRQPFLEVWPMWWVGDAIGVLIVAPLVLVVLRFNTWWHEAWVRRWEVASGIGAFAVVAFLAMSGRFPFVFIGLPILLWAALRFGQPGAAFAQVGLAAVVIRNTLLGQGIFANPSLTPEMAAIMLQFFLCVACVSSLLLAALNEQRQIHLRELERTLQDLESQIEERKLAQAALLDSRERLRAILNAASDAIITINHQGIIQSINAATERMSGYSAHELVGHNVSLLVPEPYHLYHDGYLARYLRTKEPRVIGIGREVQLRRKDGSLMPADLAISEVEHLGLFTGILRDISQRKQLEREVVEVAADEQRRLGQELHDGLGQELTALNLIAGYVQQVLVQCNGRSPAEPKNMSVSGHDFDRIRQAVENLCKNLQAAQRHLRDLARGIMPVQIDAEGLRSALQELAASIHDSERLTCELEYPSNTHLVSNSAATHLYRIAQEAVNNAVKHSQATRIVISLRQNGNTTLEVTDNGIGVSPIITRGDHSIGMGFRTMQYRASVIGGNLQVDRSEQGGTTVRCTLTGS